MRRNIEYTLVCPHIPRPDGSIMPSGHQGRVPLRLTIEEHETGDGIRVTHNRLYLFIAVQVEEPQLVVLGPNDGHLLIIIYQEFIGLLEDEGFVLVELEVEDLLLLGGASIEDGEEGLGVGDRELVLLGEEPGATGGHDQVALHAAALEPAE